MILTSSSDDCAIGEI